MVNPSDKVEATGLDIQPDCEVSSGVALRLFAKDGHELAHPIYRTAEKRLLREIDCLVNAFICITRIVTSIDKATLGYAAVLGLQENLQLSGTEYSWA